MNMTSDKKQNTPPQKHKVILLWQYVHFIQAQDQIADIRELNKVC